MYENAIQYLSVGVGKRLVDVGKRESFFHNFVVPLGTAYAFPYPMHQAHIGL